MAAFFRTGVGENAIPTVIVMFDNDSTLCLITHGTQTIDKTAVYDVATKFMIYLMVYSVNHGQVEYKRLRLGNFKYDSPTVENLVR